MTDIKPNARPLLRFLLFLLLAYMGLQAAAYIPAVNTAYRQHFISLMDKVFKNFRQEGIVKAGLNPDREERELDVEIMLSSKTLYRDAISNNTTVRIARTKVYSNYLGYLPLSLLLALILATPLHWRRKTVSLLTGVFLIEAFLIFRLWIHLTFTFNSYDWLEVVSLSDRSEAFFKFLSGVFVSNPVVGYLVPIAIWLLVAVLPFPRSPISYGLNKLLLTAGKAAS